MLVGGGNSKILGIFTPNFGQDEAILIIFFSKRLKPPASKDFSFGGKIANPYKSRELTYPLRKNVESMIFLYSRWVGYAIVGRSLQGRGYFGEDPPHPTPRIRSYKGSSFKPLFNWVERFSIQGIDMYFNCRKSLETKGAFFLLLSVLGRVQLRQ